jgi:hypothetical protein
MGQVSLCQLLANACMAAARASEFSRAISSRRWLEPSDANMPGHDFGRCDRRRRSPKAGGGRLRRGVAAGDARPVSSRTPAHPSTSRLRALRDNKAEPEQFAPNPRRAPKHILDAHPPDQCPQFRGNRRPTSWIARLPAPVATKSSTVPAHDRLGLNNRDCSQDRRKPTVQLHEEQAIGISELNATG